MGTLRKFANLFHRVRVDRDIAAELDAHLAMRIEENMARGMTAEEARRSARVLFGNPLTTRERVFAADATLGLEQFWTDVRHAWRQLAASPGFTVTAVPTIAVGIGANTSIFSSMDAVVLRPLAVPALDRVVTVFARQDQGGDEGVALADYGDWTRRARSFEEMAVRTSADMSLTGAGDAVHVEAALTSGGFFSLLRTPAVLGRVYTAAECRPGHEAVVLLNYGFWQRRFGGDRGVLGRTIQLDLRDYTILGVLPKSVQYPAEADVFLPLAPTAEQLANRSAHDYLVTARLRDGVSIKQAQAEMRLIAAELQKSFPVTNRGWSAGVEPLLDEINGDLTPLYYRLVMGATFFVLLVVCANVANLQFARGIARRPEIAMRTALGATRMRLMRQLLSENVLLGLMGGAGGLVLGSMYLHLTLVLMPERVARHMAGWSNTSLNGRVFLLSLALAVVAGVASGVAPAFEALRLNLADQLKAGARTATGAGRRRLRGLFAVAQVSLAVALVIGATLMAKGMWAQLHCADAYSPDRVLVFQVTLPAARYDTAQKQAAWYERSLASLRALPGVKHANIATALPYSDQGWNQQLQIEGRPTSPGQEESALRLPVSPDYFSAFHIPILEGRAFSQADGLRSVPVAIVSRRFMDLYFGGRDPVGHRIRMSSHDAKEPWLTIVGVAEEAKYTLWDRSEYAAVYLDAAQIPPPSATYALITDGNALSLARPAQRALASLDPALPLDALETYRQQLNDSLVGLMFAAGMLSLDAVIALLLASIGIFGVMANLVGERTREIGVRLALGARREDVLRWILRHATRLTAVGLGAGLVLAFFLARMVANLLFGVRPSDPLIFAMVTVAVAVIATLSSWIPARRAARLDPIRALRSE